MSGLIFILRRQKAVFSRVLAISLVVNTGMALLTPIFLKQLFDRCVPTKDLRLFLGLMAGFLVLATAWRLLNFLQNLQLQRLKNGLCRALVADSLKKYYRLPYAQTLKQTPAYFASRIFDEPLAACAGAVDLALDMAGCAVSFVAAAALLTVLSAKAALLLAACVPVLIALAQKYGAAVKRQADAQIEAEGRLRGFVAKAAQAYRSVRLFALGKAVADGLEARLDSFLRNAVERLRFSSMHNTISATLMSYAEMLVIIVCGYEMMRGRMTFGGFMAFMSAFWTAVNAMRALAQKAPELASHGAMVARLRDFLAAPETVDTGRPGGISLRGVSAGYEGREILSNLNLELGRSERVLLSGRNGSGKSTLAGVLAGFLAPTAGAARTPRLARVSAGLTPHFFIPGTVAQNFGREKMTPGQADYLDLLLKEFCVEGVLDRDPESLSSGQRKKVEVIQALLKDADLYLFDEPLANVDAESKPVMLARIFERAKGKALVVVMHGDEELRARFDSVIELDAVPALV